jgi:hypothetical protein
VFPEADKPQLDGAVSPKLRFIVTASGKQVTVLVGVMVKFVGIMPTVTVLLYIHKPSLITAVYVPGANVVKVKEVAELPVVFVIVLAAVGPVTK